MSLQILSFWTAAVFTFFFKNGLELLKEKALEILPRYEREIRWNKVFFGVQGVLLFFIKVHYQGVLSRCSLLFIKRRLKHRCFPVNLLNF